MRQLASALFPSCGVTVTSEEEKPSFLLHWGHLPSYFFMISCGDLRMSPSYRQYPHPEQTILCGILYPLDNWAKTQIKALLKHQPRSAWEKAIYCAADN